MVRETGLEPARSRPHTDLNRTRLPIPPFPHIKNGGRGWIRTIVVCDNGFTVRSLWPLGNPSIIISLELVMGLEPATC